MLGTASIRRAADVLNSKEVPKPMYLVWGKWSFRQGPGPTEFSEDYGKTWLQWDDEHPACKWFAEKMVT